MQLRGNIVFEQLCTKWLAALLCLAEVIYLTDAINRHWDKMSPGLRTMTILYTVCLPVPWFLLNKKGFKPNEVALLLYVNLLLAALLIFRP
jgi:hypothetical protein